MVYTNSKTKAKKWTFINFYNSVGQEFGRSLAGQFWPSGVSWGYSCLLAETEVIQRLERSWRGYTSKVVLLCDLQLVLAVDGRSQFLFNWVFPQGSLSVIKIWSLCVPKAEVAMFLIRALEVTHGYFCGHLLVTQVRFDSVWEGPTQCEYH